MRLIVLLALLLLSPAYSAAERIKVGVPLALTGDLAAMGADARDGILVANETLGQGRYELVFEDTQCTGKNAVEATHKFLAVDKVKYIVGFSCNSELLAANSILSRAQIPVIAVTATTGDAGTIGQNIFRPFPADHFGALLLYQHMKKRFKRVVVISEEEEYATLLARAFRRESEREGKLEVTYEQFPRGTKDFRSLLLRVRAKNPDAIFLNASGEASFIPMIKQARDLKITQPLFAEYVPGSRVVLEEAAREVEGIIFADLPDARDVAEGDGARLIEEMNSRFGPSRSISLARSVGYESFRFLDEAIRAGADVEAYLSNRSFKSNLLGDVAFAPDNTLTGLTFRLKVIREGKAIDLQQAEGTSQ